MSLPISIPVILTTLAGALAIISAIIQNLEDKAKDLADDAKDQRIVDLMNENAAKTAENLKTSQESNRLIQDIAAKLGNSDAVRELVDLRSKELNTSPAVKDSVLKAILENLPDKIDNYKALQTSLADLTSQKEAAIALTWEEIIRSFIKSFYDITEDLKKSRPDFVRLDDNPDFKIFGNQTYLLRWIRYKDVNLMLEYGTFTVTSGSLVSPGMLRMRLSAPQNEFETELKFREETVSTSEGLSFQVTDEGKTSPELSDHLQKTLAQFFQRLLVIAESK